MDINFNAVSTGVEYSQLTDIEKKLLADCLRRLSPVGWTAELLHVWYVNRKLCVVRDGGVTKYYGLLPTRQWRLLLEVENDDLRWKVGVFQWLPVMSGVEMPHAQRAK